MIAAHTRPRTTERSLVAGAKLPANEWAFSGSINVPEGVRAATFQLTDPADEWMSVKGNVIVWGIQMYGRVAGPWDSQYPWVEWGWWLYEPAGDPREALILPQLWTPFGRHGDTGKINMIVHWDRSTRPLVPNTAVRLAIRVDTEITLGASALLYI